MTSTNSVGPLATVASAGSALSDVHDTGAAIPAASAASPTISAQSTAGQTNTRMQTPSLWQRGLSQAHALASSESALPPRSLSSWSSTQRYTVDSRSLPCNAEEDALSDVDTQATTVVFDTDDERADATGLAGFEETFGGINLSRPVQSSGGEYRVNYGDAAARQIDFNTLQTGLQGQAFQSVFGFPLYPPVAFGEYRIDPLCRNDLASLRIQFPGLSAGVANVPAGDAIIAAVLNTCGGDKDMLLAISHFLGETKAMHGVRAETLAAFISPFGDMEMLFMPTPEEFIHLAGGSVYSFELSDISATRAGQASRALQLDIHVNMPVDAYSGPDAEALVNVNGTASYVHIVSPLRFERTLPQAGQPDGAVIVTREDARLTVQIAHLPAADIWEEAMQD